MKLSIIFGSVLLALTAISCTDGDGPDGDEGSASQLSQVGGTCTAPTDCASGLDACNDDPGGQCTHACTTQADCDGLPGGAICETGGGNCYKLCQTKADCPRDGFDCIGGP